MKWKITASLLDRYPNRYQWYAIDGTYYVMALTFSEVCRGIRDRVYDTRESRYYLMTQGAWIDA